MNSVWLQLLTLVLPYLIKFIHWAIGLFSPDEQDQAIAAAAKDAQIDQVAKAKEKCKAGLFKKCKKPKASGDNQ